MFVCPFTGEESGLVPSWRLLKNNTRALIWVHPDFKNVQFIPSKDEVLKPHYRNIGKKLR